MKYEVCGVFHTQNKVFGLTIQKLFLISELLDGESKNFLKLVNYWMMTPKTFLNSYFIGLYIKKIFMINIFFD